MVIHYCNVNMVNFNRFISGKTNSYFYAAIHLKHINKGIRNAEHIVSNKYSCEILK